MTLDDIRAALASGRPAICDAMTYHLDQPLVVDHHFSVLRGAGAGQTTFKAHGDFPTILVRPPGDPDKSGVRNIALAGFSTLGGAHGLLLTKAGTCSLLDDIVIEKASVAGVSADGPVGLEMRRLKILACPVGVSLGPYESPGHRRRGAWCSLRRSVIRHCDTGVLLEGLASTEVVGCNIEACGTGVSCVSTRGTHIRSCHFEANRPAAILLTGTETDPCQGARVVENWGSGGVTVEYSETHRIEWNSWDQ